MAGAWRHKPGPITGAARLVFRADNVRAGAAASPAAAALPAAAIPMICFPGAGGRHRRTRGPQRQLFQVTPPPLQPGSTPGELNGWLAMRRPCLTIAATEHAWPPRAKAAGSED